MPPFGWVFFTCTTAEVVLVWWAQLAMQQQVFIIDLLALNASPALNAALGPLLHAKSIIKSGCGIAGDLKKLAKSYPHMTAFQAAHGLLDLHLPYRDHMLRLHNKQRRAEGGAASNDLTPPMEAGGKSSGSGLSAMAAAVLGKPLDKSMQVCLLVSSPSHAPARLLYPAVCTRLHISKASTYLALAGFCVGFNKRFKPKICAPSDEQLGAAATDRKAADLRRT